jgi:hypothetical protein
VHPPRNSTVSSLTSSRFSQIKLEILLCKSTVYQDVTLKCEAPRSLYWWPNIWESMLRSNTFSLCMYAWAGLHESGVKIIEFSVDHKGCEPNPMADWAVAFFCSWKSVICKGSKGDWYASRDLYKNLLWSLGKFKRFLEGSLKCSEYAPLLKRADVEK